MISHKKIPDLCGPGIGLFFRKVQCVYQRSATRGLKLDIYPIGTAAARVAPNGVLNTFAALALMNQLERAGCIL